MLPYIHFDKRLLLTDRHRHIKSTLFLANSPPPSYPSYFIFIIFRQNIIRKILLYYLALNFNLKTSYKKHNLGFFLI